MFTALAFSFSFPQIKPPRPRSFCQPTGRLAGSNPTCQARQTRRAVQGVCIRYRACWVPVAENEADHRHGLTDGLRIPSVVPIFSSHSPLDPHYGLPHPRTSPDTISLYETCPGSWTLQASSCCAIRASVLVTHSRCACFLFTSLPVPQSSPTGHSWIPVALACLEPRPLLCCTQ